ncbi:NmrA family NAD(P)-binding protein [Nocardia sp. NPDC051570]|uniref:NmrA family NAD(P)-binding protein n=1 Tax=Nocardia sp. NPDC051570 TaxID=3364324 RepID=UPI00378F8914
MNDILILGGTGTTGRRIAARLRDGGHRVRIASRTRGDVRVDLDEPSTWRSAVDGVSAAYLLEPTMQGTEEGRQRIPRFVDAAVAAGVRGLVLLSAPGAEDNETHPLWRAEEALRSCGLEWTIVRPTWFAQNFSEAFWLPGIRAGSLVLPTGDGATAFVDADDIADVVVAALTRDGHHGASYVLTGPRAISFAEAVDLIGAATGRTIRHVDIDPEAFTRIQIADGVPAHAAQQLTRIYTSIREGEAGAVLDGVRRALGREPRAFIDYVSAAAAAGAWN